MQKNRQDGRTIIHQIRFKVIDGLIATGDRGGCCKLSYSGNQHVFIMRAIEDADHAWLGYLLADSPEKPPCLLGCGWRLERGDLHALRIEQTGTMTDHPTLP